MRRFLLTTGLLLVGLAPIPAQAGQLPGADTPRTSELPAAARPGAFCAPGACRPAPASAWSGAAFGAAVIAIGWQARRRPPAND